MSDWTIYPREPAVQPGDAYPNELQHWLDQPPPWRDHTAGVGERKITPRAVPPWTSGKARGQGYIDSGRDDNLRVNMALFLRRPLLVTGLPGLGKSSLAYHIAHCLELGPPLRWEIGSRTTLREGLYDYDAVSHLRAAQGNKEAPIGEFITLGPLGTALLPTARPRVLLVDELDKASYDLPNDLLHVFEEGHFAIRELIREGTQRVTPWDPQERDPVEQVEVDDGLVQTLHHPVVVITSNNEREFPPAFLRRCVQLDLKAPDPKRLKQIVSTQLKNFENADFESALETLKGEATDVVLQAAFLQVACGAEIEEAADVLRRGGASGE
jgi:MoxR-like ATPase